MLPQTNDISLGVLLEEAKIPYLVYCRCGRNGLTTVQQVIDHYRKHSTFLNLPNVGVKTEALIIKMVRKYDGQFVDEFKKVMDSKPIAQTEPLVLPSNTDEPVGQMPFSVEKQLLLQYFLNVEREDGYTTFEKAYSFLKILPSDLEHVLLGRYECMCEDLSSRARNALYKLEKRCGSLSMMLKWVLRDDFNFRDIVNVGNKCAKELAVFRIRIETAIIDIAQLVNQQNLPDIAWPGGLEKRTNGNVPAASHATIDGTVHKPDCKELNLIRQFSSQKRMMIVGHIEMLHAALSIRARSGLNIYFNNAKSIDGAIEDLFKPGFNFSSIKSIGQKTAEELAVFKNNLASVIIKIGNIDDERVNRINMVLALANKMKNALAGFEFACNNFFNDKGQLLLFKVMNWLFLDESMNDVREVLLFSRLFVIDGATSEEVMRHLNITKERLRQITHELWSSKIKRWFNFISFLTVSDIQIYQPDMLNEDNYIVIDEDLAQFINKKEGVAFNTEFYFKIFSLLFQKSHSVSGNSEQVGLKNSKKNVRQPCRYYLVPKSISDVFDVDAFIGDINSKLNEKIDETYSIYFNGYLQRFLRPVAEINMHAVRKLYEQILVNEFQLLIRGGMLTFQKNTRTIAREQVYEVLNEHNRMMHITEIISAINQRYTMDVLETSVRAYLRDKQTFLHISRSSTYGLKRWELEKKNLKGGTIKDLVEEYLSYKDEPRHISEITKHVVKYRKTSRESIIQNLRSDRGRFKIFKGSFVGIRSKRYDVK